MSTYRRPARKLHLCTFDCPRCGRGPLVVPLVPWWRAVLELLVA